MTNMHNHYENLLIHGYCWKCKSVLGIGTDEEIVERADELRKAITPADKFRSETNEDRDEIYLNQ